MLGGNDNNDNDGCADNNDNDDNRCTNSYNDYNDYIDTRVRLYLSSGRGVCSFLVLRPLSS
jgi:hypothetical protein